MRRGSALPSVVFAVLMLLALGLILLIEREPNQENVAGLAGSSGNVLMSATPNPCVIPAGESACAVTITWMADGSLPAETVQVWRVDEGPRMVACAPVGDAGSLVRALGPGERQEFRLFSASDCTDATAMRDRSLASVTIASEGGETREELLRRTVARAQEKG